MKKKIFYTFCVLCIILISGCVEQKASEATPTKQKVVDKTLEKWSDFVAKSSPFECDVKLEQDDGSFLNMKVFLRGNDVREEMTVESEPITLIFSKGSTYMNNVEPDKREAGLEKCDWIQLPQSASGMPSEQFYDIEFYESIGKAKFICNSASFGAEKFVAKGIICDMSALMETE